MAYRNYQQQHRGGYAGRTRNGGVHQRLDWTHPRDRQQRQPTDRQEPRNDIGKTLEKVVAAITSLSNRIEFLEKGPDRASDRPNSGQTTVKAGPSHATKSNNDEFSACVRDIYRLVQLEHHTQNWRELPRSLAQRLERFASDINPPMVNDELRSRIKEATQRYGDEICDIVHNHMVRKRTETEAAAAQRDDTDVDRAKEIADRQLSRRLGRRLEEQRRQQLVDSAANVIGSARSQPKTDADGFQTVARGKKAASSPGNVSTPTKKRKMDATPTVITSNRFSSLADAAEDGHEVEPADSDDDVTIIERAYDNVVTSGLTGIRAQVAKEPVEGSPIISTDAYRQTVRAEIHDTGRSHNRSISLEKPTRSMRPSTQVMRTPGGVFVFTGPNKTQWQISPASDTKTLLIGDSNLKQFTRIPKGWEIHCCPGARLSHVNDAVEHLLKHQANSVHCVSQIYVQAGINHRDEQPQKYDDQLQRLMLLKSQTPITVSFVGVPTFSSLTTSQRSNIHNLNQLMSDGFGEQYVTPIPDEQVEIEPEDKYRIHHTLRTTSRILLTIREHAQLTGNLN